jgi:2-polyprenyl-3-methyl-5-hydroxy-6-metoxy-1,4-benzoquinol methylase
VCRILSLERIGDRDPLVSVLGWRALVLYGDPCAFDRWLWVRRRALRGPVRTLDAGSGNGAFALYLASQRNRVTGVSDYPPSLAKAERRAKSMGLSDVSFRTLDLRQLDRFAGELGSYDQILCLEVIEHILDDRKLLRDFAELVRPGGRLLLTTPFRYHVPYEDELVTDEEDGGHVRSGYTHEEMERLLAEAGFRVASRTYISGSVSQRLVNLMQRLNRVQPHLGWAVTLPLRLLRPLDRPLTRLSGRPYLSIAVEAVRT